MLNYILDITTIAFGIALIWGPICAIVIGLWRYNTKSQSQLPFLITIPVATYATYRGDQNWKDWLDLSIPSAIWIYLIAASLLWVFRKIMVRARS